MLHDLANMTAVSNEPLREHRRMKTERKEIKNLICSRNEVKSKSSEEV